MTTTTRDAPQWRRRHEAAGDACSEPEGTSARGRASTPEIVRPDDVGGRVAWWDLTRCGAIDLVLEDAAVPRGTRVDACVRAAAIAVRVPHGSTLGGLGAAWVLAGGVPPEAIEAIHAPGRHRPVPTRRLRPRQALLLRDEVLDLGGLRVTAPLRTALDVATFAPRAEAIAALRLLADRCGLDLATAHSALELRYRWPRRDHARRVLHAARGTPA